MESFGLTSTSSGNKHPSWFAVLRDSIARAARVLSEAFQLCARRLQPRMAPYPAGRQKMRAGLLSLDDREYRAEQVESQGFENMPTRNGFYIRDSAPVIDEQRDRTRGEDR